MGESMGKMPKTRQEALDSGSTHYYTGKRCIHGHLSPRFTSSRACKECINHRNLERTKNGYWKEYGDHSYRDKKRQYAKSHYRKNKDMYEVRGLRRRQVIRRASVYTPEGHKQVKLKYLEAQRLSLETGVEYVVDHIIPLQHPLVSGLHNDANTQVITAEENRVKGNSFSIEDV